MRPPVGRSLNCIDAPAISRDAPWGVLAADGAAQRPVTTGTLAAGPWRAIVWLVEGQRPAVVALAVSRESSRARAIMPMPRTKWSQLSALLTGTKFAGVSCPTKRP